LRIVGGKWRGRKLETPKGEDIRPTTDMVKESIFNIIQFETEGAKVLDLFCGTGQLGLEALSRGAIKCVFVDSSKDSCALTAKNINTVGAGDMSEVIHTDALSYLSRAPKFDIVLIDPPYGSDLFEKSIKNLITFDILRPDGIIICETRPDVPLPGVEKPYYHGKQYKYGKIRLALIRREGSV